QGGARRGCAQAHRRRSGGIRDRRRGRRRGGRWRPPRFPQDRGKPRRGAASAPRRAQGALARRPRLESLREVPRDGRLRRIPLNPSAMRSGVEMNPLVPSFIESLAPYIPGKPIEETEREYGVQNIIK